MVPQDDAADILALAARLVAAIEARDGEAVRACYHPQARIWHNTDDRLQSVEENVRSVGWIHKVLAGLRYDIVRRVALPDGFLQQHVLRGRLASGEQFAMPACVICRVEGGAIVSLDEYLDSAQAARLRAARPG